MPSPGCRSAEMIEKASAERAGSAREKERVWSAFFRSSPLIDQEPGTGSESTEEKNKKQGWQRMENNDTDGKR